MYFCYLAVVPDAPNQAHEQQKMEFLSSLPKVLADAVLGFLKLRGDDRTRQRTADLLEQVAACVSTIGANIASGVHDAETCMELSAYVLHVRKLVAAETDEQTATRLMFWLEHVGAAPGYAKIDVEREILVDSKPRWTRRARMDQADEVKRIAGAIRGIANMIRV